MKNGGGLVDYLRVKIILRRVEIILFNNTYFTPSALKKIWLKRINKNLIKLRNELKLKKII